jgi:DNA-binding response OmpR family regulator
MSKMIYIADDDENVRVLLKSFLEKEGYFTKDFANGDLLFDAFLAKPCDLIVLDIMMPGSNGFVICTKLREISSVPIILLTARDTEEDYVSGISLGSDDYITKPFSPVKLTMRIKAMFRRIEIENETVQTVAENSDADFITYGDITIYPEKLTAYCNSNEINLTNKEFWLVAYLLRNPSKAVSREELLTNIWGYESIVETRVTDDTIKRIRRKLSAAESSVSVDTVWGHGFKITVKDVSI